MNKYLKLALRLIILMAIWYLIFGGCLLAFQKLSAASPAIKDWLNKNFFVSYVILSVLGGFFIFLYFKFQKISMAKFCKYNQGNLKKILLAVGYGAAVGLFSSCFTYVTPFKQWFPQIGGYFIYLCNMGFIPFFVIVGSDSIFKETLFRGAILNEMRKDIPLGLAILIQGLFYAVLIFYSDFPTRVYGMVGNILFALIYVLAGSIWASITVQLTSYLVMFSVMELGVGKGLMHQYGGYLMALSIIILLIPVYLYFKNRKTLAAKATTQTAALPGQ